MLAERRSGRLLGAQIVGKEGAAKRIDVFATAIWNGMAVDEMVNLDLSYAPPFSPVWDPVLIAVRKVSEQVDQTLGANSEPRPQQAASPNSSIRAGRRPRLVASGRPQALTVTVVSIGTPVRAAATRARPPTD